MGSLQLRADMLSEHLPRFSSITYPNHVPLRPFCVIWEVMDKCHAE